MLCGPNVAVLLYTVNSFTDMSDNYSKLIGNKV